MDSPIIGRLRRHNQIALQKAVATTVSDSARTTAEVKSYAGIPELTTLLVALLTTLLPENMP